MKKQDLSSLCKELDISSIATLLLRDLPTEQKDLVQEAKEFLPEVTSALIVSYCYATEKPPLPDEEPRGHIAPYMWASFYRHLRKKLVKLSKRIGGKSKISVNGRLSEKPWALAAELGFRGEHSIIITPHYGSLVILGILLTSEALPKIAPPPLPPKRCEGCQACMKACPTKALAGNGVLIREKCIQHLCAQAQPLAEETMKLWGNRLYGCSTCQDVCPYNSKVPKRDELPQVGLVGPSLPLLPILKMTEEEFRRYVTQNQMARRWVDFRAIKRNALLAVASYDDDLARKTIESHCSNEDELLRQTARYLRSIT